MPLHGHLVKLDTLYQIVAEVYLLQVLVLHKALKVCDLVQRGIKEP